MPAGSSPSKLPLFVTQSGRDRDEFLRGVGITDYDDINLFNLLCSYAVKRGSPKIPVVDFLSAVNAWARSNRKPNLMGGAAKTAFRRMVTSLERNGYAATKDDFALLVLREGERRAGQGERAVLEIEKAYGRIETDPATPYPGTTDISVPPTALVPVAYTEVTREFVRSHVEGSKILRITFGEDADLLATPAILGRLLEIARRRVHFYIQNNPALYNYALTEIRKIPQFRHVLDQSRFYGYLDNRADTPPLFWVYLGLAVVRSRNEDVLEPKLASGRVALFQSACLLNAWWQAEHRVEQERKQRRADEEALLGWMERAGRGYTLEEMGDVRDESGKALKDKYPDIRVFLTDTLDRLHADASAAGKTAALLSFGELWMHRAAVIPRLEEEVRATAEYARRVLETDFRQKLERGAVDDPAVNADAAFVQALVSLVDTKCARLAAMLKKPQMVHALITEDAVETPALFRTHAALFEALDRPAFKRMDLLLGLNREELVGHIVSGMSLIRRFLLRRRFRLRKPAQRGAKQAPGAGRAGVETASKTAPAASPSPETPAAGGAQTVTVKTARPGHHKPQTVVVESPRKRKGPKTMDEAMDKLKEAMSKKGGP